MEEPRMERARHSPPAQPAEPTAEPLKGSCSITEAQNAASTASADGWHPDQEPR